MTKHSSGPWEYVPKLTASENHKGFFVRAEKAAKNGTWALAEIQPGDEDGKLGEANARLIAAAPQLLSALIDAREHLVLEGLCAGGPTLLVIDAAISRATGICAA